MNPIISIIIPTYNRSDQLKNAIKSVAIQKFMDWEIIVVDDGSIPPAQITNMDSRIQLYKTENRGRSAARNFGFSKASGKHVLFMDDDDELVPDFLETIRDIIIDDDGQYLLKFQLIHKMKDKMISENLYGIKSMESFKEQIFLKGLSLMQVLIPRIIGENFNFDESMESCEDQDYFLKLVNSEIKFKEFPKFSGVVNHSTEMKSKAYIIQNFKNRSVINRRYGLHYSLNLKFKKLSLDYKIFIKLMSAQKKLFSAFIIILISMKQSLYFLIKKTV